MGALAHGLLGGALIGLSATVLLWSIGRIAGISGVVNGLGTAPRSDRAWRAAFLLGLMAAGGIAMQFLSYAPARLQNGSTPILLLAGLLVGDRKSTRLNSSHG